MFVGFSQFKSHRLTGIHHTTLVRSKVNQNLSPHGQSSLKIPAWAIVMVAEIVVLCSKTPSAPFTPSLHGVMIHRKQSYHCSQDILAFMDVLSCYRSVLLFHQYSIFSLTLPARFNISSTGNIYLYNLSGTLCNAYCDHCILLGFRTKSITAIAVQNFALCERIKGPTINFLTIPATYFFADYVFKQWFCTLGNWKSFTFFKYFSKKVVLFSECAKFLVLTSFVLFLFYVL